MDLVRVDTVEPHFSQNGGCVMISHGKISVDDNN